MMNACIVIKKNRRYKKECHFYLYFLWISSSLILRDLCLENNREKSQRWQISGRRKAQNRYTCHCFTISLVHWILTWTVTWCFLHIRHSVDVSDRSIKLHLFHTCVIFIMTRNSLTQFLKSNTNEFL